MPGNYHPAQPALYERLMESQYWQESRRSDHQRDRLERLLRHAREHVPFYERSLDVLFTPHGDIDWARWTDVPIVKRRDVFEHQPAMLSRALPATHGRTFDSKTSGSTGMRITIRQSEYGGCVNQVAAFRGYHWHGIDWTRNALFMLGNDRTKEGLDSPQSKQMWGPRWIESATGQQFTLNRYIEPGRVFEYIRTNQISYLITRPIEAHALALEALASNANLSLGGIIGVGTAIQPNERADCKAAFGTSALTPYGAKEGGQMAFPCPEAGRYHVNEENVLVEVLDEEDQPCAAGQAGRVIVTPFYNFAQPLIRYEQGDLAILGAPCKCGRSLRVIEEIVGRQEHLFHFPGIGKRAITMNYDLLEQFGVRQWQIAQVGPLSIEVRYVPAGRQTGDPAGIVQALQSKASPADIEVLFRPMAEIPRQPGGKVLSYVYEVRPEGAGAT